MNENDMRERSLEEFDLVEVSPSRR